MTKEADELRLDLCLYNLRFCKTRPQAQALIEKGRVRVNQMRAQRPSRKIRKGDVLVFPAHNQIFAIEILGLPEKRVGAEIAQSLYQKIEIAAAET